MVILFCIIKTNVVFQNNSIRFVLLLGHTRGLGSDFKGQGVKMSRSLCTCVECTYLLHVNLCMMCVYHGHAVCAAVALMFCEANVLSDH